MILGIKTENKELDSAATVPIIGGLIIFALIFIVPVLLSFLFEYYIFTGYEKDFVFGVSMAILLPIWNLTLWFRDIKLYLFFMPAWLFLGIITSFRMIRILISMG